jgi:hypothetical protein
MFFIKKEKNQSKKKTSRLKIVQICTRVKNTFKFFHAGSNKRDAPRQTKGN